MSLSCNTPVCCCFCCEPGVVFGGVLQPSPLMNATEVDAVDGRYVTFIMPDDHVEIALVS
jgi:hypothetical protein